MGKDDRKAQKPKLIRLISSVAARCPLCGQWASHRVNLFSLGRNKPTEIRCDCGCQKMTVGRSEEGRFWIDIPCVLCETTHSFEFTLGEFYSKDLKTLLCGNSEAEIGFLGTERQVRRSIRSKEDRVREGGKEEGLEEYFEHPDVMYGVLEKLHGLAKGGNLRCPCGHGQIEVDIYPDRLELKCAKCKRSALIQARTLKDLQLVSSLETLDMSGSYGRRAKALGPGRESGRKGAFEGITQNGGAGSKPRNPKSKRGEE